jgi:outer membrane protein, heavy metal efflux system
VNASRLHQTRAEIATLVADLQRIADERMPLAKELPELARAEAVLSTAVQSGDATLLGYEAVRANLLDKQLKLLSLDQATAEQQIALQLAVGAPLILQDSEP